MVKYFDTYERRVTGMIYTLYIAAVKNEVVVGHVPCKISSICVIFIRHGGCITYTVTGRRWYSANLVQGEWKFLVS